MKNIYILSATRTAVGSFQGALSQIPAPKLGAAVIKDAVAKAQIKPDDVKECIMGEVLTAAVGQAPARQAALYGGLSPATVCMTINKVCGSGLKAVMLAADSIALGNSDVVVAGGQESMSLAPHALENSRTGYRMGPAQVVDTMVKDGLWDPYNNWHMGNAAELCVKEKHITREEQDQFATESYKKAQRAIADGLFVGEITPIEIADKKGTIKFAVDEDPGKAQFEKMLTLKPAFDRDGTITAANASKINDGAAALVLASEDYTQKNNLTPIARVVSQATFAQDPKWFTTAPIECMKMAIQKAGLTPQQIDFYEINEAFSVVTMAAGQALEIPKEKINVHGGAVAIGHPIGGSGARILTTLIHALRTHKKRYGLATLCIGGGEAVAMVVEAL